MAETTYITTKEQCQEQIDKRTVVCSGCGRPVQPIETVDNGGNPTYWPGCLSCSSFDYGVPPDIFKTANYLVRERGQQAYHFEQKPDGRDMHRLEYWFTSQVRGMCSIVQDVIQAHKTFVE